ncbi:MAG: TIGR03619 family F420-dependent LLM class oxidoreductase, partial [Actinomycetes bacterium]
MRDFDRGTGVLIVLHGHHGDPADARRWGRALAPPGWEVVAPGAPRDASGGRSWFESGPRGASGADLAAAIARLADTTTRIRSRGQRVVVAGFSQGAALAVIALRAGLSVDGVVAIRPFLPEFDPADVPPIADAPSPPAPVLVSAGRFDDVVPAELSGDVADVLALDGRAVEQRVEDSGHVVTPETLAAARRWMAERTGHRMRVSVGLPTDRVHHVDEFVSVDGIVDIAAAYERLGFDACYVTDHPAPDERWLDGGGHHALDPAVALAVAAVGTRHLLLHTHVYVLAYRNPFVAAKALASVDAISDGRLVLGVAAGYLRPEFAALGVPFGARGRLLDEALELLPRIWSGQVVEATGDGWSARAVRSLPVPRPSGVPPVWVGGNSDAAMRRAVRFGDAWAPFAASEATASATRTAALQTVADLGARIERLREMSEAAGRTSRPDVCFTPFALRRFLSDPDGPLDELVDEVDALADLGVRWITLEVPGS